MIVRCGGYHLTQDAAASYSQTTMDSKVVHPNYVRLWPSSGAIVPDYMNNVRTAAGWACRLLLRSAGSAPGLPAAAPTRQRQRRREVGSARRRQRSKRLLLRRLQSPHLEAGC